MKYNIKVTNKETKTVWFHDDLTKEEISWIQCNKNLLVEIRSESSSDLYRREPRQQTEYQD